MESSAKMRYIGAGNARKSKGKCSIVTPQRDGNTPQREKSPHLRVAEKYNLLQISPRKSDGRLRPTDIFTQCCTGRRNACKLDGDMMNVKIVLLAVISGFMSHVVFAGAYFETGSSLVQGWREHQRIINSQPGKKDYNLTSRFVGYVTGVADSRSEVLDVPAGVTKDQLCAIVGTYLENHPDEWNEVGSILVEKALRNSFGKR